MTPELKDALDRYRRWKAEPGFSFGLLSELRPSEASVVLADAYLAEHPADDEEPVTEEWLRAVGLGDEKPVVFPNDHDGYEGQEFNIIWVDDDTPHAQVRCLPYPWHTGVGIEISTRGHVRRLCAALGVPLKEPG